MDLIELKALEEVNELRFTESEREVILNNFSEMEKNEEALKGIDTNGVESTVFVRPLYNVLREDKRVQPFSREDLLACSRGELFGPGNSQLPAPNMLMMDRIIEIRQNLLEAEYRIKTGEISFYELPVEMAILG